MTIFSSFSANFPPLYHTILAINCAHASNWFTHLQRIRQIHGQNDNSVLTVTSDCKPETRCDQFRVPYSPSNVGNQVPPIFPSVWGPGGCVMWKWALRASPYISRKIGPRSPYYTERIGTWGPPFEYGCPLVIMRIPCMAEHNHIIWGSPALLTISPVGDSLYGRSSITNQFLTWAFLYNIVW